MSRPCTVGIHVPSCNFTHRTAHASGDAPIDVQTDVGQQAVDVMQREFASVFGDPEYPIQRDGDVFKHRIDLIDKV